MVDCRFHFLVLSFAGIVDVVYLGCRKVVVVLVVVIVIVIVILQPPHCIFVFFLDGHLHLLFIRWICGGNTRKRESILVSMLCICIEVGCIALHGVDLANAL